MVLACCFVLGKPFIPKQVTASDRNKLGFKYSVRSYMNKEWGTGGKSQEKARVTTPDNQISAVPEEDYLFSESIDDLESFGQDSTKVSKESKVAKNKEAIAPKEDDLFGENIDDLESFGQESIKVTKESKVAREESNNKEPTVPKESIPKDDLFGENIDDLESFGQESTKESKVVSEEFNIKEPNVPKESITQVDGTLSSLSFTDLELQNVSLVDVMSDPGNIVFDPSSVDIDESLLAQLDGADTSDEDDELMIDLGDNDKSKDKSTDETIDRRRSSRLRSQNTSQVVKATVTRSRTRSGHVSTDNIENPSAMGKAATSKATAAKEGIRGEEDHSNQATQEYEENVKNDSSPEVKHDVKSSSELIKPSEVITSLTGNAKAPVKQKIVETRPQQEAIPPPSSIFSEPLPASKEIDILDSLLLGQSALHGKQQLNRDKKKKSEYKGEDIRIGAPVVGNIDEYLPPFPGYNYSYSLWNLANAEKKSNFRLLIRSKVCILEVQLLYN